MRQIISLAIGLVIASFTLTTALEQEDAHQRMGQDPKHNVKRQDPPKQSDDKKSAPRKDQRQTGQPPVTRRSDRTKQQGSNGQGEGHRNDRSTARPPIRPNGERTQNPFRHARPDQVVIQPNGNWAPNRGHRYNSATYTSINIWGVSSYNYHGQPHQWDPGRWRYAVEDSLMGIVYRSERMSNTLRDSFEGQLSRNGLRSSRGGDTAWNRVQRMDESLEKLRSETGYVSDTDMRESANDVLALSQQVANSFYRHPELRELVRYEWEDLSYELNELARYYGEPAIR